LADELVRFRRREPILARPISRMERGWRWCRRNPSVAGVAAVCAVLALVILIGAPVWAIRESQLRGQARRDLAKTMYQAAQLAGQRGRWREAEKYCDEALAAGHPDPTLVRLERLKAIASYAELPAYLAEVQELLREGRLGKYESEVRLLEATVLWAQDQDDKAVTCIEQALKVDLPPAPDAYARPGRLRPRPNRSNVPGGGSPLC
jgi:tetratricopeptide (TPR) repeat protein